MSPRDDDDRRWQALADRIAIGDPLPGDDADFFQAHKETHPECAAESQAWDELLGQLGEANGDLHEPGDDALVAAIVANYRTQQIPSAEITQRPREPATKPAVLQVYRRSRWPLIAAGGLAVAASLALFVFFQGPPAQGPQAPKQALAKPPILTPSATKIEPRAPQGKPTGEFAKTRDDALIALGTADGLRIEGRRARVGERVAKDLTMTAEAETCLVFHAPFASVCLSAGTTATLRQSDTERSFDLERGALVATLDDLPPGQAFTVRADGAQARAIGTVFLVRIAAEEHNGERVEVGVFEGKVQIQASQSDPAHTLGALEHANLKHPERVTALPQDLKAWASARSDTAALWRQLDTPSQLYLEAHRSSLQIDGHRLGQLQSDGVELLVSAGEHIIEARDNNSPGRTRARSFVGNPTAPTTINTDDLRAPARATKGTSAIDRPVVPPQPPGPSIRELRGRASDARAERAWRSAIEAYEELLRRYPTSPEAHNVRVQLGELLRRQGQPARALGHFNAYLIRGGPLAAEARFGKVLALQQLGRSNDEAAAIADFLSRHPHHIEADKLRQRALELDALTL